MQLPSCSSARYRNERRIKLTALRQLFVLHPLDIGTAGQIDAVVKADARVLNIHITAPEKLDEK